MKENFPNLAKEIDFSMNVDRGTQEQNAELSSRPKEMIHYLYLTSNQSAPSKILSP